MLKKYQPEVVRFFILRAHYRSPLNYSDAHLDDAKNSLVRLYNTLNNVKPIEFKLNSNGDNNDYTRKFFNAMNDDFGTAEAVSVLFEIANEANKNNSAELSGCLKALGGVLGLLQDNPEHFLQGGNNVDGLSAAEINNLISQRKIARETKDWAESDRIRDVLAKHKIQVKDSADGTTWTRG